MKKILALMLALLLMLLSSALGEVLVDGNVAVTEEYMVEYGLDYSTPDEVALYLHVFRELPPNFLTKQEARELGWVSSKGNLWDVAEGLSIGGDVFGNREGLLPDADDRTWYECDVNYYGGYREDERVVFSDDGLIYYTEDHYESFDMLYDGWYEGEVVRDYDYESEYSAAWSSEDDDDALTESILDLIFDGLF